MPVNVSRKRNAAHYEPEMTQSLRGTDGPGWNDASFTSRDGLRLHGRHYAAGGGRRPLLCLPGLTRNAQDFHQLAMLLSDPHGHRRDVYALDARGRGRSDSDKNWRNYSVATEVDDALDFMATVGIERAAVLGSSRGGILAVAMAAVRPNAIGVVILNDVGPIIERNGLARIIAYVGQMPLPSTWPEAARLVLDASRDQFPTMTMGDADVIARQWFNEANGRPAPGYDPAIARALSIPNGPLPDLWAQFEMLVGKPMLALRGANSDILSPATLVEMGRRHPGLETYTVPNQGHTPLLLDPTTQALISDFLLRTDQQRDDG